MQQLQKRRSDLKEDIEAAESKLQRLRMELIDVELQISMGGINVEVMI